MRIFRKGTLIIAIIALAALLTITAIAGTALLSDGTTVAHGESYHGVRVSTSGNVSLKFYYDDLGTAEAMVYDVTDPSGDNAASGEIAREEIAIVDGKYCVTVPLAPSQMNYTVKVYAKSSAGVGEAITYSVKEYAQDVLATESLSDYHNTMRALLNWGAMAQEVFGDSTDTLANDGMYALGTNPIDALTSIPYTEGSVTASDNITGNRYSVSVNPANTVMNFYVNYTGEGTLAASVSKNGGEAVSTEITETEEENVYVVNISNIGVAVYDKPYTVTVTDTNGETFTVTKSVLEYLNTLAFTTDEELVKYNNVAKSMYQLYVVAMSKTNASCQHQFAHRLSADADTSYAQCSTCFEVMGSAISNKIDKYMPAEQLSDRKAMNGTLTLSYGTDADGTPYARISAIDASANGWVAWNPIIEAGENTYTSGRYLIMKIRVNDNGLGQNYHKLYVSSQRASLMDETQGVAFKATEDAQWHVSVIDLAARVGNASGSDFVDNGDGTYTIKYLQLRPFVAWQTAEGVADATMDIAYIALCDNLSDVGSLVSETNYEWSTGDGSCVLRNSATNVCETHPGTKTEEGTTSVVCSCTLCNHELYRETFPESTNKYLGVGYIGTRPGGGTYQITDNGMINENGTLYNRFTGTGATGQIFWTRMGHTGDGTPWSTAQLNPFNVGKAKYVVVKMRGNNDIDSVRFNVGTIVGEASYDNFDNMTVGGVNIPQGALNGTDWTYFVVDLEKTMGGWNANEDGTYNVCYLQFTFNGTSFTTSTYFDISYIAFADNWAEVGELTGQDTVDFINVSDNSIKVEADTGVCVTHAVSETVSGQMYTYSCTVCGNTLCTKTVSSDVNWYASVTGMSNWSTNCIKTLGYDPVADVAYASYTGSAATHINITGGGGSGSATTESYSTGRYLVMMYRGNMSSGSVKIKMSSTGSAPSAYDASRDAANLPANWSVAVLDLSETTNYTCDSTGQIYIMLNPTTAYSIDIAYAAIVDDLGEILGNNYTYVDYGTSFANAGTQKVYKQSTNAYDLTAEEIAQMSQESGFAGVALKDDEEFTYVRLDYDGTTPGAFWFADYSDIEDNSGRYLIMKYRTTVPSGWSTFASGTVALQSVAFGANNTQTSWSAHTGDGEWHVMVFDMAKTMANSSTLIVAPDENGDYLPKFFAFKPFSYGAASGNYFDIAYVKWAANADDVLEKAGGETVEPGYYKEGSWYPTELE